MGILESVIGSVLGGNAGSTSSPMGSILSSILGGSQQGSVSNTGTGGMGGGGLGGLLQQFQSAGLGHVAQSWVGNGANQSVTPDQLQNVFGQDRVNDMAGQAGMPPGDFLSQLSQHLPNAVNGMTPNGQVPDEGSMSV
ncbi:YidB family protein [Lichenifustis flavocetrariae]|uniref:YidB family protein n=1 Tax=Lichenifustis flavocetrariae TaxID=2949735 RepID=A0AA41Z817_9HYPH|nr:YidB family protein [Lichenifustis flavocetrariae]MCW6512025.1 YidB family protein [Lichenifustis flavocetrariae]